MKNQSKLQLALSTLLAIFSIGVFIYTLSGVYELNSAPDFSIVFIPHSQLAQVASSLDTDPALVGWWKFDEGSGTTASDSSGHGIIGALSPSTGAVPTWSSNAKMGTGALAIDNTSSQYVNLGDVPALRFDNSSNFTISAWVNTRGSEPIFGKFDNTGYLFGISSSMTLGFTVRDANAAASSLYESQGNIPVNVWTHVVAVFQHGAVTFYVNGVSVFTGNTATSLAAGSVPAGIGRNSNSNSSLGYGNGLFDDVRVYSRALSASEIMSLYSLPSNSSAGTINSGGQTATSTVANNDQTQNTTQTTTVNQTTTPASCKVFYIDFDGGNDSNDGCSATSPWKHAPGDDNATLNATKQVLKPGDTVLFKGGTTYRGSISINSSGTQGNPITYKGDGWGAQKAIIDGADIYQTSWKQCASAAECGGNPNFAHIYYATAPSTYTDFTQFFFEDGDFMWYSQDPIIADPFYWDNVNSWHKIPMNSTSITQTNSSVTDPTVFTQTDSTYWVGAYVGIWINPNSITLKKITSYDPASHTIFFDSLVAPNLPYPHDSYDNYYTLLNKTLLVNAPGRFAYDEASHVIYLWPHDSGNANNHTYSFLKRAVGFNDVDESHIVFQGFTVEHSVFGIRSLSNHADMSSWNSDIAVRDNDVTKLVSNEYYAIQVASNNALIENNRVTNDVRSIGIVAGGNHIIIRNNFVSRTSRQGIYFAGANNGQIIGNTVTDMNGQHANGISIYSNSNNILVAGNTVTNASSPITFERSKDITFYNNFVDAAGGGSNVNSWGGMSGTVTFIGNTFVRNNRGDSLSLISSDPAQFVVMNNIIDGGGCAGSNCTRSNNIYTSLSWSQDQRYNWFLGSGEKVAKPTDMYANPAGDFHLKSGSPAIDTGVNPLSYLPTVQFPNYNFQSDIDNNGRPQGPGWDIGAYEYCTANCAPVQIIPVQNQNTTVIVPPPNSSGQDTITSVNQFQNPANQGPNGGQYQNVNSQNPANANPPGNQNSGGVSPNYSQVNLQQSPGSSVLQRPVQPGPARLPSTFKFNRSLSLGQSNISVKSLQIFLNDRGFTVTPTIAGHTPGAGSLGHESNYFGPATKRALIKFQEYYASDILAPVHLVKGTGYFGPSTIKKVNGIISSNK